MRTDDEDRNKRYFRSSDRFIRLNGDRYFTTREGDLGPFTNELSARRELNRHVVAQQELRHFQASREIWSQQRKDKLKPRHVTPEGLFTLESIVD